jgi:DNA replication protein DnaC
LDDFGIGNVDQSLGPTLLDIIDQQSANGSLLITSQFPTSKWHDFFSDPTVADAILDRIIHQSQVFKLQGESMRKTKSKTK